MTLSSCDVRWRNYEREASGIYKINLVKSKLTVSSLYDDLELELDINNTYHFSKVLPFIDQEGKWNVEGDFEVRYVSLISGNGRKDRVSICCDDNNEITFHCYLDSSGQFERIIFREIKD